MTYFVDFAKNLTQKKNIGVLVYLILNTLLIVWIFSSMFEGVKGIFIGILTYGISLIIALSPIGEWVLRVQTGCKKITRKEYLDRLEPLFQEALSREKKYILPYPMMYSFL